MLTIESLKNFGADTDEGMARCLGNADLYLRLVASVPGEQTFELLSNALAKKDLDAAFEAAHALKGALSNLALTPLSKPVSEITELLRAKADADYSALLDEILAKKEELAQLCQ